MSRRLIVLFTLLLSACLPLLPSESARSVDAGERLLNETFDRQGNWSAYDTSDYSIRVSEGAYRMRLSNANQYIYGSNRDTYDNTIIEVDVTWLSDTPYAFAGVICRLHPENGQGYYVVVSAGGDFSIRYLSRNNDDAIVRWQSDPAIPRSGSFRMRVICVDDFIALYINESYVDGAEDSRLQDGQIGLTTGLPRMAEGAVAQVAFDDLRVWDGILP